MRLCLTHAGMRQLVRGVNCSRFENRYRAGCIKSI